MTRQIEAANLGSADATIPLSVVAAAIVREALEEDNAEAERYYATGNSLHYFLCLRPFLPFLAAACASTDGASVRDFSLGISDAIMMSRSRPAAIG